MKELATNELQKGTSLIGELYLSPESKYLLLGYGIQLSDELVRALKKWQYLTVFTDGTGEFVTDDIVQDISLDNEDEDVNYAIENYKKAYADCSQFYKHYKETGKANMAIIINLVKQLMNALEEKGRFVLRLNLYAPYRVDYFISHAIETTILSLAMARYIKMSSYKMFDLGISCLLHEIGLLRMPSTLLDAKRTLTTKEKELLMAHTVVGFDLLKNLKDLNGSVISLPMEVIQAVLQHHERMDGSGYRQGLRGGAINEYAQIIGIACSYHAQIADRPFRKGKDQHLSIAEIVQSMNKLYDARLVRFLLEVISLYPIGSYVKLSDGSIGKIIDVNPNDPLYPIAQIVYDADGEPMETERKLVVGQEIKITHSIREDDIPIKT